MRLFCKFRSPVGSAVDASREELIVDKHPSEHDIVLVPSHDPGVHLGFAELFLELKAFDQMLEYFEPAIFFYRYLSKLAMLVEKAVDTLVHS